MPSALSLKTSYIQTWSRTNEWDARGDYFITAGVIAISIAPLVWLFPALAHWFLFPVIACGVLAGVEVVRWLRGGLDLFDPRTIVGCLALYGFFVAPILHVIWNRFGAGYDLILWNDWRPWLGAMAALNAGGLIAYRLTQRWAYRRASTSSSKWEIAPRRFYPALMLVLIASAAGVTAYLWQMGGVLGEMTAFETDRAAYVGTGWLLILAWPLAVLCFILVTFAWTQQQDHKGRLMTAMILLGVVGAGHFFLMGWYGSRSATIWALFWMAGIIHYRFRALSPRVTAAGAILLIGFMYFYGFYKERGRAAVEILKTPAMWMDPTGYERDLKGLLLDDLARADSNAFILRNLVKEPDDYDYRWGLTYAGAFAVLIPKPLWPDRPEFKVEAGTEAQFGKATFLRSSRVYGLPGEALLNFGPFGVVPIFAVYGAVMGLYRRKLSSWDIDDARMFLAPLFTMWFANAFVSDSDNLVYAIVIQGTLVLAAFLVATKRRPVPRTVGVRARSDYR